MKINNMNIINDIVYIAIKLSKQGKPMLWAENKIVTNIDQIELPVILLYIIQPHYGHSTS